MCEVYGTGFRACLQSHTGSLRVLSGRLDQAGEAAPPRITLFALEKIGSAVSKPDTSTSKKGHRMPH